MGNFLSVPGKSIYGASQAAMKLMSVALHLELVGTVVRVTGIYPGAPGTSFADNFCVSDTLQFHGNVQQRKFNHKDSKDTAQIILARIEKKSYRIFVGSNAKIIDFIYLGPRRVAQSISNQVKSLLPERLDLPIDSRSF